MAITLAGISSPEEHSQALEQAGLETESTETFGTEETPAQPETPAPPVEAAPPTEAAAPVPPAEAKRADGSEPLEEAQDKEILEGKKPEQFHGQKRLLRRIDRLTERLRTAETKQADGTVTDLQSKITELERQLAEKTPAPATEEIPPVEENQKPQRPKRPKLADFKLEEHGYDEDQRQTAFQQALDKFDDVDLPAYEDALAQWNREEAVRQLRAEDAQKQETQSRAERQAKYDAALAADADLVQVIEQNSPEISVSMEAVMREYMDPEDAATCVKYLARHPEESKRIAEMTIASKDSLDPKKDAGEIAHLLFTANRELGRVLERATGQRPAAPAAPAAAASPAPPPERPKPAAPSQAREPIEPVSSRVGGAGGSDLSQIKTSDPDALKRYEAARKASRR